MDAKPSLSPKTHIRRIIKEVNHTLVNLKFVFKHGDKEVFRKRLPTCIKPKIKVVTSFKELNRLAGEGPKERRKFVPEL